MGSCQTFINLSAVNNLHFTCPTHTLILWRVMLRMVRYIRYPRPLELGPGLGGGTETTETLSPGLEIVESGSRAAREGNDIYTRT